MFHKFASYLSALALAVMLTACATPGQQPGEMDIRTGIIEQINPVQLQSSHHAGVGAVVGGIAGLGLGSLTNPNLFKGQRVYVEGNGDGARVVPR